MSGLKKLPSFVYEERCTVVWCVGVAIIDHLETSLLHCTALHSFSRLALPPAWAILESEAQISPVRSVVKMPGKKVCLIGAGPSGMSVLSWLGKLTREGREVPEVVCYEKQGDWGGLWNYTWRTGTDQYGEQVHGSMYRSVAVSTPGWTTLNISSPGISGPTVPRSAWSSLSTHLRIISGKPYHHSHPGRSCSTISRGAGGRRTSGS